MSHTDTSRKTAKRKRDWWIYTIPTLALMLLAFELALFARPGIMGVGIYYLGPALVSFLAVIFLLIGLIQSAIRRPFFTKWRLAGFIGLLLFPFSFFICLDTQGNFMRAYPSSHEGEKSAIQFRLPLDTPISVAWGGDKAATNYHVIAPDQRWAYDLLVAKEGKTFHDDSSKLENYYCYGLPVLAPAGGKVITAFDKVKDMPIGDMSEITNAHGNHIIIKVAPRQFLFLCHLKPGSQLVKTGDSVQQGQVLAQVGNSGHTSEPHVHIHLQDTKELSFGEGIPLYFSNYLLDGKLIASGMPLGGVDEKGNLTGQVVQHRK